MRFEGTLTSWNDERGFGYIESTQGGEPIFVHVSAWPNSSGRPQLNQRVTFEVEVGPKGRRARSVELIRARRSPAPTRSVGPAQWGTATLFAIPAFLAIYAVAAVLWKPPAWVAGVYIIASVITFAAYAIDKSSAKRGTWRTPESTLHLLALIGGWPGALLAQQFLRHKSTKQEFRQAFWVTAALNVALILVLVSPMRGKLLGAV